MQENNDTPVEATTPPAADPSTDTPAPELTDAGRKALEAERESRKAAEKKAKELEERLAKIELAQARRKIAQDRGLSDAQAELLQGASEDELAAYADRLTAAFAPKDSSVRRRPSERLTPGAVPMAGDTPDFGSIADAVVRGK